MYTITKFQDTTMKDVVASPSPVILMPLTVSTDTEEQAKMMFFQSNDLMDLVDLGFLEEKTDDFKERLSKELAAINSKRVFRVFVPTELGMQFWAPIKGLPN